MKFLKHQYGTLVFLTFSFIKHTDQWEAVLYANCLASLKSINFQTAFLPIAEDKLRWSNFKMRMNLRILQVYMGAKPNVSILRSCHCEHICSLMIVLTLSPHNVYLQPLTSIKFANAHVFQNQFWNCLHTFLIFILVKVEYDVMAHIAKVITLL